jgi:hypothetical protein
MTNAEALKDLDYVRTLAEEGRHAPLLSGPHLIGWGVLVAAAWAGHGYIVNNVPPSGQWGILLGSLWGGFGVLGGLMSVVLGRWTSNRPGASAASNRAERAIWSGASLVLTVFAVGMIGHMAVTGDTDAPNAISAAAFGVYGGAMLASSLFSGEKLLRPFAFLAAGFGLVLAIFADAPWAYYAAAVGALLTLALPGLLLARREPATTV